MGSCKPVAVILGLPFAVMTAVISILAAFIWVVGRLLHKVCPCIPGFDGVADKACGLTSLPMTVMSWFWHNVPC